MTRIPGHRKARVACLILGMLLLLGGVASAGGGKEGQAGSSEMKTLNIGSVFLNTDRAPVMPVQDMVAPAIQAKGWTVNVKEFLYETGGTWLEKLNLYVASGTLPDIFEINGAAFENMVQYKDLFVDLTSYLSDPKKAKYISKYLTPRTLEMMKTKDSRQIIGYPVSISIDYGDPAFARKYQDDFIQNKTWPTGFAVREDVLKMLGYKFTPIADIEASMKTKNRRLTYDDIKITPEIKTVADFEKFLNDVKNLNLKTKAGDDVIPMGGYDPVLPLAGTFGYMFYRYNNGQPSVFFGGPDVKLMFQTLNKWTRTGLLDRDAFVLRNMADKLSDKVAQGKYAIWWGEWLPDGAGAIKKFEEAYNTRVRVMPGPWLSPDKPPYFQDLIPGASGLALINKNYKDVDKLLSYLDWLWSDEAQDIVTWGKAGGIWEIKNGKKVFKDPQLWEAIKAGPTQKTANGEDATYYGITNIVGGGTSPYTIWANANVVNPSRYKYSYPASFDTMTEFRRISGAQAMCTDGTVTAFANGEEATKFNQFFWAKGWDYADKIAVSQSDAEFEANWKQCLDDFYKSGDYAKAMADQLLLFKRLQTK